MKYIKYLLMLIWIGGCVSGAAIKSPDFDLSAMGTMANRSSQMPAGAGAGRRWTSTRRATPARGNSRSRPTIPQLSAAPC